jgi:hypothetical protein
MDILYHLQLKAASRFLLLVGEFLGGLAPLTLIKGGCVCFLFCVFGSEFPVPRMARCGDKYWAKNFCLGKDFRTLEYMFYSIILP